MKYLIIFIYLITSSFSYAIEKPNIENLVLIKKPKLYEGVVFKDKNQKEVNLAHYKGKLLLLKFKIDFCKFLLNIIFLLLELIEVNINDSCC